MATVRLARPEDIPQILDFFRLLAIHQKEPPESVEATEQSLLESVCFASAASPQTPTEPISPTRPAKCILVFPAGGKSGPPAGLALYFYNYSTWRGKPGIYIEDIYVRQEARGQGLGRALMAALAAETQSIGGARLEWSVLNWNEGSIKFYEAMGAKAKPEWVGMRVDGDALAQLAAGGK